jgi:tetratricopeptide (TPR) repeat protein
MTPAELATEGKDIEALLSEARSIGLQEPRRAIALAEAAERLAETAKDEAGLVRSLLLQGECWYHQALWDEARQSFLTALAWARHRSDATLEADCLHHLGQIALQEREIPTALEWFFRALETLGSDSDHPRLEILIHSGIGSAYGTAGRYQEAGEALAEALQVAQRANQDSLVLSVLGNSAMLLEASGNLTLARTRYEETLEQAIRQNHAVYVAQTQTALCRILTGLGQLGPAREHGQKALALADATGSPRQRILARRALGEVSMEQGFLDEAEQWLMEALELAEGERLRADWSALLHALGRLSLKQDEPILALQYHEAALTQAIEDGSAADQVREHRALAALCEKAGDLSAAIRHLKAQILAEEFVQREAAGSAFLAAMARLEWEKSRTEATL